MPRATDRAGRARSDAWAAIVPFWIRLATVSSTATRAPPADDGAVHAAGADRCAEPPAESGRRDARRSKRDRSGFDRDRTQRGRRDDPTSQPPDRRLSRRDGAAAGRDDLDHDVAARSQPRLRDDGRARSAVAHARSHRPAVLSARARGAEAGRAGRPRVAGDVRLADAADWPDAVRAFWESGEAERFGLSGSSGDHVDYLRRRDGATARARGVEIYSRDLRGIRMEQLVAEAARDASTRRVDREPRSAARIHAHAALLLGAAWLVSLAPLVFIAHRISQPIQQLTAGLDRFRGRRLVAPRRHRRRPGHARRATKSAAPSTRSTTWPISCARTASGSCISRRSRAGSRWRARPRTS